MAYEIFDRAGSLRKQDLSLSVSRNGDQLILSAAAARLLRSEGISLVYLALDRDASRVAIIAATGNDPNAYPLSNVSICAGGFVDAANLTPSHRYKAVWNPGLRGLEILNEQTVGAGTE